MENKEKKSNRKVFTEAIERWLVVRIEQNSKLSAPIFSTSMNFTGSIDLETGGVFPSIENLL